MLIRNCDTNVSYRHYGHFSGLHPADCKVTTLTVVSQLMSQSRQVSHTQRMYFICV